MEKIENLNESELVELWQVNQIPEETQRIFDAVGLRTTAITASLAAIIPYGGASAICGNDVSGMRVFQLDAVERAARWFRSLAKRQEQASGMFY